MFLTVTEQCSKTCGGGFKRRQVVCHDELLKESNGCIPSKQPQDTVHCNTDPCPSWSSGEWSHVWISSQILIIIQIQV